MQRCQQVVSRQFGAEHGFKFALVMMVFTPKRKRQTCDTIRPEHVHRHVVSRWPPIHKAVKQIQVVVIHRHVKHFSVVFYRG